MRGFIDGEYQDGEARGLVFLAGTAGYGKTTEATRIVESGSGPAVMFDPNGTHSLRRSRTIHEPRELKEYLRSPRGRVLYQPCAGDMMEHFRAACRCVFVTGGVVFFVDEVDMFCGPEWGDKRMPPELYDIANYRRHVRGKLDPKARGLAMVFTAREPMRVARGLTSAALSMRLFQMNEPDYVKYFREFIGGANSERLKTLPKFHYLLWHKDPNITPAVYKAGSVQKSS